MKKTEALKQIKEHGQRQVRTYWWNFRKKTADFDGQIKYLLKKWNCKVEVIQHPQNNIYGYRFKAEAGSSIITMDMFSNCFEKCAIDAVRLLLTYLGDRFVIQTSCYYYTGNN